MLVKGFAELVLVVKDVAKAAEFYKVVVGLEPLSEPRDDWAWFWVGDPKNDEKLALTNNALLFEEHSPHPEGNRWGNIHFALQVDSVNLETAIENVREHKIEVFGPQHFKWMNAKSYYFYDLDGNLIEYWSKLKK